MLIDGEWNEVPKTSTSAVDTSNAAAVAFSRATGFELGAAAQLYTEKNTGSEQPSGCLFLSANGITLVFLASSEDQSGICHDFFLPPWIHSDIVI